MDDKMNLRAGDVIGVSRGAYEHYAVYAGNGRVIHYCGEGSDFAGKVSVHEAPFEEFLKGSRDFFVVSFDGKTPKKIHFGANMFLNGLPCRYGVRNPYIYSRTETLKRAYSRIGEEKYNIFTNNCEHFAMWCKTGKAESTQVNSLVRFLVYAGIRFANTGALI